MNEIRQLAVPITVGTTPSPSQKRCLGLKQGGERSQSHMRQHTSHIDEVLLHPLSGMSTPKIQFLIVSPNFEECQGETDTHLGLD